MKESFYVYILSSLHNRVLYIGLTSDLKKRIWEHKNGTVKGFTKKYNVDRLVYYEVYDTAEEGNKKRKKYERMATTVEN